jgi:hypothetical protein
MEFKLTETKFGSWIVTIADKKSEYAKLWLALAAIEKYVKH